MADLKDYRKNELSWFLVANILMMLVAAQGLHLEISAKTAVGVGLMPKLFDAVAASGISLLLTLVLDSVVSSHLKDRLLFLGRPKPSATIFTDILHGRYRDDRFTKDAMEHAYRDMIQVFEESGADQTPYWYKVYNKHREVGMVFGSNRGFLLLRDMYVQVIVLLVVLVVVYLVTGIWMLSWTYAAYSAFMLVVLNIAARVQGKRMCCNVIAYDLSL